MRDFTVKFPVDDHLNTLENARSIYDVFVTHLGAFESQRPQFVEWFTNGYAGEYRFVGELGLGGKFCRDIQGWRMKYYELKSTPERQEIKRDVNRLLYEMWLNALNLGRD